eukprot:11703616-Alexandrium_andersonii.AAC.1
MERRITVSWLRCCEIGRCGRRSRQHSSSRECDQFAPCPCSGQLSWACSSRVPMSSRPRRPSLCPFL